MLLLNYAKSRLWAVLSTIQSLQGSEFPYSHSKDALEKIQALFKDKLARLEALDESSDPETVRSHCANSLKALFRHLPILGFILRSTNVRNAFEVFGPLLDISRRTLEPSTDPSKRSTKLLLSSEWTYSPMTYHEIPDLPGIVLIGLPAPESSNPLLIPLSGHELGHSIWVKNGLDTAFEANLKGSILTYIGTNWAEYSTLFPSVNNPDLLTTNLFARETWTPALQWALKQAQESFCDFFGVRIYGRAFLEAFAYLLGPNVQSARSPNYPNAIRRVENLVEAASKYSYNVPDDYISMFKARPEPALVLTDRFRLKASDHALDSTIDKIIQKANQIISATDLVKPDEREINRIYERLQLVVPAQKCRSLADIVNAGWRAYNAPDLWSQYQHMVGHREDILKDLVLKTIEIYDVEHILGSADVDSGS